MLVVLAIPETGSRFSGSAFRFTCDKACSRQRLYFFPAIAPFCHWLVRQESLTNVR
jgi:hypothetical protein